jgi:D-sedoheptulose 7-phosphate isomerase
MTNEELQRLVADSVALKRRFFAETGPKLIELGARIAERLNAGARLLAFGNGGSASDAQHFVAELVGRLAQERAGLSAIALTSDASVVTAISNDMGYAAVFRRQLEAHARPGDVALGISTSGRSPNVVEALRAARARGLLSVGLTGEGGGELAGLVDHLLAVPHPDTQRVQEVHSMVLHVLAQVIEAKARA